MGKRHLKMLKSLTRPKSVGKKDFQEFLSEEIVKEDVVHIPEQILDSAKYLWFKKKNWNYTMPTLLSALLICILLTYQNCGGKKNSGATRSPQSVTNSSNSVSTDLQGKYFALTNAESKLIAYLEITSNEYTLELQYSDGSSSFDTQENRGSIEHLIDDEFFIKYEIETCNPIKEEKLQIKKGVVSNTLEVTNGNGTFIFKKADSYSIPKEYVAKEKHADNRCFSSLFRTSPANVAIDSYAKKHACVNGVRKKITENFYSSSMSGSYNKGLLAGHIEKVYLGFSPSADIIALSKISGGGYNLSASYCSDNTTNSFFIDSYGTELVIPSNVLLEENSAAEWGSLYVTDTTLTTIHERGGKFLVKRDFDFSFGDRPYIGISSPSNTATDKGPIIYSIKFYNAAKIDPRIELIKTGNADGVLSVSFVDENTLIASISNTVGDGTLSIAVPSGVAIGFNGNHSVKSNSSSSFIVDNTGPFVSFSPPSIASTNNKNVFYTITTNENAQSSIQLSDFSLNKSGTASAVLSMSGTGSTKTIMLSDVRGDGTLWLSVREGALKDSLGNTSNFSTSSFVVVDNTAPSANFSSPSSSLTKVGPVSYLLTYNGASSISLGVSDLKLNRTGTANGYLNLERKSESSFSVSLTEITGSGTLGISLNTNTAKDSVGNTIASTIDSPTFQVDNEKPFIRVLAPSTSTVTQGGSSTYLVTIEGASFVNLNSSNVLLLKTGTANGTLSISGTGNSNRSVVVSNIIGSGTLSLQFLAGSAIDEVGNTSDQVMSSEKIVTGCVPGSLSFNYTGTVENFIVPESCTKLKVVIAGGAGGAGGECVNCAPGYAKPGNGGNGAIISGLLEVNSNQVFKVYVAQKGGSGEKSGSQLGGGGGGASALINDLNQEVVAISGGGGGGESNGCSSGPYRNGESSYLGNLLSPSNGGTATSNVIPGTIPGFGKGGWGYRWGGDGGATTYRNPPAGGGGGGGSPGGKGDWTSFDASGSGKSYYSSNLKNASVTSNSTGNGVVTLSWEP